MVFLKKIWATCENSHIQKYFYIGKILLYSKISNRKFSFSAKIFFQMWNAVIMDLIYELKKFQFFIKLFEAKVPFLTSIIQNKTCNTFAFDFISMFKERSTLESYDSRKNLSFSEAVVRGCSVKKARNIHKKTAASESLF